jgi:hypothetical protein
MNILEILLFPAVVALLVTLIWYKGRRKNVEISGLKESKLESFYREFATNYVLSLFTVLMVVLLDFLIGLIL